MLASHELNVYLSGKNNFIWDNHSTCHIVLRPLWIFFFEIDSVKKNFFEKYSFYPDVVCIWNIVHFELYRHSIPLLNCFFFIFNSFKEMFFFSYWTNGMNSSFLQVISTRSLSCAPICDEIHSNIWHIDLCFLLHSIYIQLDCSIFRVWQEVSKWNLKISEKLWNI